MGIVRITTTMSLDGFMAGPNHEMDWVFEHAGDVPAEITRELIDTTGAILAGRGSYNVGRRSTRPETGKPFGGAWTGPQFVLTHDPPEDEEDPSITFVSGDFRTAVETALDAAGGKNVLLFGANVANQGLEAGLVDDILILLLPVLLGDGVRLFDAGGAGHADLEPIDITRYGKVVHLHYRVAR
jgi:dihydrofolate reductase